MLQPRRHRPLGLSAWSYSTKGGEKSVITSHMLRTAFLLLTALSLHAADVNTFSIVGYDPVANSQVTAEEIRRCEADPKARLRLMPTTIHVPKKQKGARYTPVAKRNDRPDAIAFLLRNYPHLSEAQIVKLLGTTKDTIQKVRDRHHWNSANIKPRDPVILGLCSQTDLNAMVQAANDRLAREGRAVPPPPVPEAEEAA